MTYEQFITESGKFNDKTKYRLIPSDNNIARLRVLRALHTAMERKKNGRICAPLDLLEHAMLSIPEHQLQPWYQQNVAANYETMIAKSLAILGSFMAYRDYKISADISTISSEVWTIPLSEMFERFKNNSDPITETNLADVLNRSVESRFEKHEGVLPLLFYTGQMVCNYHINIEKHLQLYFRFTE